MRYLADEPLAVSIFATSKDGRVGHNTGGGQAFEDYLAKFELFFCLLRKMQKKISGLRYLFWMELVARIPSRCQNLVDLGRPKNKQACPKVLNIKKMFA
jgi:hypothetical protein